MDAPRISHSVKALHLTFRPRPAALVEEPLRRPGSLTAQALWLGLVSGWVEVGVIAGHRAVVGTVTRVSVWFNNYHLTLGLIAHLAIFLAWLGLASILSTRRLRFRRTDALLAFFGWFLACLSPLLAAEEIFWPCSLVLAAGIAARLAPWWARRGGPVVRRTLLPLGVGSVLFFAVGFARVHYSEARALAALPAASPDAPNIVLVILDTVRADHLSLYGYGRRTTPHLDALAARSVRFDLARSPASWTLPAHASMFTGRWPHELSTDLDRPLDATHTTLAELLSRQGYATGGFVGNTFYCNDRFGIDRGFAHYEDTDESRTVSAQQILGSMALGRALMPLAVSVGLWPTVGQAPPRKPAHEVNSDALAWLDGNKGRPAFLFLNYIDAHGPYTVPDRFPREFSRWTNAEMIAANVRARKRGNDRRLPPEQREAAVAELARMGIDSYDDCIRYEDDQIGRLMAELERRGLDRNTWVIITADHGEHFGEHGKYWHGNSLYRPLIDVPLVVVPPKGVEARRRVTVPVSTRDLSATIADLVGVEGKSPFPGRSLRRHWDPAFTGPMPIDPPLSELRLTDAQMASESDATKDRFRASVVHGDRIYHRHPNGPEELYDACDPGEQKDLLHLPEEAETLDRVRPIAQMLQGN